MRKNANKNSLAPEFQGDLLESSSGFNGQIMGIIWGRQGDNDLYP